MPGVSFLPLAYPINTLSFIPQQLSSAAQLTQAALLGIFATSALFIWRGDYEWHDQQRLAQLLLLLPALASLAFRKQLACPPLALLGLCCILLLGLASGLPSLFPGWALLEWSHWIGLLALFLLVSSQNSNSLQRPLLLLLCGTAALQTLDFTLMYAMAFITSLREIDINILTNGFSNIRHYGQFQTLVLPLLAAACLSSLHKKPWLAGLVLMVMGIQWCIALALGGRGLYAAVFASHLLVLLLAPKHWRLAAIQGAALLTGYLLFLLLFKLIPNWLELQPVSEDLARGGLSRRQDLWLAALNLITANPWLGAGPMHYSAEAYSSSIFSIASHAHQAILQWAAEWGLPATLIACVLIGWGLLTGLARLRSANSEPIDSGLWLSLCGAWILAQVDGVMVMPYTQTWLAIIAGLAAARWCTHYTISPRQRLAAGGFSLAALCILIPVIIIELPAFVDRTQEPAEHHLGLQQRFWANGPLREKYGDHPLWPFDSQP